MIGRTNTTLTLVIFVLIFTFQVGIGAVVSMWPAEGGGHAPAIAHQTVWTVLIAMQIASAIWYVMPSRALEKAGRAMS
jgi:hypothetical protein